MFNYLYSSSLQWRALDEPAFLDHFASTHGPNSLVMPACSYTTDSTQHRRILSAIQQGSNNISMQFSNLLILPRNL